MRDLEEEARRTLGGGQDARRRPGGRKEEARRKPGGGQEEAKRRQEEVRHQSNSVIFQCRTRVAKCFSTPVLLVLGLLLSAYNTCSCIIGTFLAESRRVTVNSTTVEFNDLSVHFWKPSGQL